MHHAGVRRWLCRPRRPSRRLKDVNSPIFAAGRQPRFGKRIDSVRLLLACAASLLPGLSASGQAAVSAPTRYTFREIHMGVAVRIVVYADSEAQAAGACESAFTRFADLEQIMSDYRAGSELMQICAKSGGPPVHVSATLFDILSKAQVISRKSNGTFDVTVGPAVQLWRHARKYGVLPTEAEIRSAKKLIGWRNVVLDPREQTVRLKVAGMRLDLGGIGKGYACDSAQSVLKDHGIRSALIEAGGDIVVTDPPPGESGWRIELANRTNDPGDRTPAFLILHNCAISSSGDTEQYVEIGGKRYSHIVNPATGYGLTTRVAVTVVAPNGSLSDPLTKGVCILPEKKANAFIASFPGVRAWIRHLPLGGSHVTENANPERK